MSVDIADLIGTAQAQKLAQAQNIQVSRHAITQAANQGLIEEAFKLNPHTTSAWIFPRHAFLYWLLQRPNSAVGG